MIKQQAILTIFLVLTNFAICQESHNREFINVKINTYDKIILIDHQNLNFQWYYGRIFEIIKNDDKYELYRIEQYNNPYLIEQTQSPDKTDTLGINKMEIIDNMGISQNNKKDLKDTVNFQNSIIYKYYSKTINLENSIERKFIRKIDSLELNGLEEAINAKEESFINNTYSVLGIDSTWFEIDADSLFNKYNHYKANKKAQENCINCMKDIEKVKLAFFTLNHSWKTSDYPYCAIQLIKGQDTLTISTIGQEIYMLPWNIADSYESYNANISIAFGNLLPDNEDSNKRRLSGQKAKELYEEHLTEKIIDIYCKKNRKKLKTN